MARAPTLSDEEIVARARPVFVERGYAVRTRQIAAAVGLTWGAIALRFGSKRALFTRAMAGPAHEPDAPACEQQGRADLPGLVQRLRAHLWECWPRWLQASLASASATTGVHEAPDALAQRLAVALDAQVRRGAVRSDIHPQALAQMVLALVTGDVARRFVAGERSLGDDRAFIDVVVRLLSVA